MVLTVIGDEGATALCNALQVHPGLERVALSGQPLRFKEQRAGSIKRLAQRYAIELVDQDRWQMLRQTYADIALLPD